MKLERADMTLPDSVDLQSVPTKKIKTAPSYAKLEHFG